MQRNQYWAKNADFYIKKTLLVFMVRSAPDLNLDIASKKRNEIIERALTSIRISSGEYLGLIEDVHRCFDDLMMEFAAHPRLASKSFSPRF